MHTRDRGATTLLHTSEWAFVFRIYLYTFIFPEIELKRVICLMPCTLLFIVYASLHALFVAYIYICICHIYLYVGAVEA